MEEKKIITTEEEIAMLIGLAQSQICDSHDESEEDLIVDVAGDICIKVNDHLTGRKKFSEEDIARYKTLKAIFDFAEKVPGVKIIW